VGCGIGVAMIAGAASGLSGYIATEVANGRKPTVNSALKATAIGGITGAAGGALATGGSALIKAITNKIKPGGAPGATGTGSSTLDDLGRPTTSSKTNTNGNTYSAPPGGGGVTDSVLADGRMVTFGHGGRHLPPSISVHQVNQAIADDVVRFAPETGRSVVRRITVGSQVIEYRAFVTIKGIISVGTYYIPK
jgi:hypothetical protein